MFSKLQVFRFAGHNCQFGQDLQDLSSLDFPLFVKPVAECTARGSQPGAWSGHGNAGDTGCRVLATYNQPVMVEEYLPVGSFTWGVTGNGAEAKVTGGMGGDLQR